LVRGCGHETAGRQTFEALDKVRGWIIDHAVKSLTRQFRERLISYDELAATRVQLLRDLTFSLDLIRRQLASESKCTGPAYRNGQEPAADVDTCQFFDADLFVEDGFCIHCLAQ
jgi:hypothetical protein